MYVPNEVIIFTSKIDDDSVQSENSTSTDSSTTIYKRKKPNNKKKTVKNTAFTRTKYDTLVVLESDINNGNYF